MAILSSSTSLSFYRVDPPFTEEILSRLEEGLQKYTISDIDGDSTDSVFGWTSQKNPFQPDFSDRSFGIGNYFVFSLRIDKKNIPVNVFKKYMAIETEKRLQLSGNDRLSKEEKRNIADAVRNNLLVRIPSSPNIFDVFWNYEEQIVYLCSVSKAVNEIFETLFKRTFKTTITRFFPYTTAFYKGELSPEELDSLYSLQATSLKG